MCGIAGIVTRETEAPPTLEQLRKMCDTMVHRGPDEEGTDIRGAVALGMRRLSIIDVAGGHQPYFNEDRTVRAVFNGEIYNFRELRRDLQERGHRFNSATDGEVIVHLWEEHGPEFVTRLNGMFGIAVHDARQRRLLLARDRIGIKPFFYSLTPRHLVFGSEIQAILASGLIERRLDPDALGQYVSWEYVPAPRTLFQTVQKLEPGWTLELDLESFESRTRPYWTLPLPPRPDGETASPRNAGPRTAGEWEDAIDAKLAECVRRRLVSDVPLGAFLSGGVDSSLVVSAMGGARTFSIGFDDPSYSEVEWSRRVAGHLGVSHKVEIIKPDIVELFEHLMRFMDDPIGDFSIFPTYLVSRLARQEVTVALSGDGGDELFGGYETYVAQRRARLWARIPSFIRGDLLEPAIGRLKPRPEKKGLVNKLKRFVEGLSHDPALGHARWRLFVGEALRRALFTEDLLAEIRTPIPDHILRLFADSGSRSALDRSLYVDVRSYLSDNILVKVDRMSMACSLEARVPFLDHEMVELAFRTPPRLKVNGGETKVLLKRVAAKHVPRECVYRPKEGFSIPIKNWLQTKLRPLMEELLSPERLAAEGVFRADTVERLKTEHLAGTANHSHVLWALLVFEKWRRLWKV